MAKEGTKSGQWRLGALLKSWKVGLGPGDGSVEMEGDDHDALMMISGGALHVVPNATRKSHGKTNCAALRLPERCC